MEKMLTTSQKARPNSSTMPTWLSRIWRLGIRQKVALILLATLLQTLTVSGWLALQHQKKEIMQETNLRGAELTRFLANTLANNVVSYDYHAIELLLEETLKNEDIVYASVLSAKGNIMATIGDKPQNNSSVIFNEDIRSGNEVVGKLLLGLSTDRIATALQEQRSAWIKQEFVTIILIVLAEFMAISYMIIRPITTISDIMAETKAFTKIASGTQSDTSRQENSPETAAHSDIARRMPVLIKDEIGDLARAFVHLQEHTHHAMDNLRKSENKHRALVEAIPDMMFRINNRGIFLDFKIPKNFRPGLLPESLAGKHVSEILPADVSALLLQHLNKAFSTGDVQIFYYTPEVNGKTLNFEARISVSDNDNGEALMIVRDATEQKDMEERIQFLAYYDSLTHLPNRLLFKKRVQSAIRHAQRGNGAVAVLIMDLDRFKIINDTLGDNAGDLLLQGVAERLQRLLRTNDYIARQPDDNTNATMSRLAGDEFTILLTNVSNARDAGRAAQRIAQMLSTPFRIHDNEISINASMGIALYPDDGTDEGTLIKNASAALHHAKSEGRNNYQFFTQAMNDTFSRRLILENHLRKALERHELQLYYQPQIHIVSGEVIGMEALLRWKHPELGLVSPAEFIPLAEDTGLIVPIGAWVLRTACAQNAAWQTQGISPLRVAVNLSSIQFKQPGLVTTVSEALRDAGLDPRYLELELTEGTILRNDDDVVKTLQDLKSLGTYLSIDDFGTGYSSLSYLKRFPIDTLKIDRSFVNDITTSNDGEAITSAIIAMAHSLKFSVVAEGVETEEQLKFLHKKGCNIAQGFLFSPPVPVDVFPSTLIGKKRLRSSDNA